MIEKERLEELIKQEATIWNVYTNSIQLLNYEHRDSDGYYGERSYIKDGELIREVWGDEDISLYYKVDQLFETKEEAEWQLEFGNVTRTETLNLPTWEEFQKDGEFSFLDKQGFEWDLYSPDDETRISLVGGYDHYEFDYTKENYTLACRKAKELFLGEKEN